MLFYWYLFVVCFLFLLLNSKPLDSNPFDIPRWRLVEAADRLRAALLGDGYLQELEGHDSILFPSLFATQEKGAAVDSKKTGLESEKTERRESMGGEESAERRESREEQRGRRAKASPRLVLRPRQSPSQAEEVKAVCVLFCGGVTYGLYRQLHLSFVCTSMLIQSD